MLFLIALSIGTALAATLQGARRSARSAARVGLAIAMVVAGVSHWLNPVPFLQHLPPWVPGAEALIFTTGGMEVILGLALLLRQPWRRRAGLALAAFLVAVFPANVYVAVAGVEVDGLPGGWYPWLRLPFQLLFVAWALWSTASSTAEQVHDHGSSTERTKSSTCGVGKRGSATRSTRSST